jgi:hypothetical protein
MWQVVSGTGNLLNDCDLQAAGIFPTKLAAPENVP